MLVTVRGTDCDNNYLTETKQAGLSDSQLYKQAGNSVTVPVIKAIAERMDYNDNRQEPGEIVKLEDEK